MFRSSSSTRATNDNNDTMADGIPAGSSTRGVFIVVEGLDRAGKSSQCELLRRHLEGLGFAVTYIRFPGLALSSFRKSYQRGSVIRSYADWLQRQNHGDWTAD